jgi:hypothetical protein
LLGKEIEIGNGLSYPGVLSRTRYSLNKNRKVFAGKRKPRRDKGRRRRDD